jgi:hypothetical protein
MLAGKSLCAGMTGPKGRLIMAKFSKGCYVILGSVLANAYEAEESEPYTKAAIWAITLTLVTHLARDNKAFNREHFLEVVLGNRAADSKPPRDWSPTARCEAPRCHHLCQRNSRYCDVHQRGNHDS